MLLFGCVFYTGPKTRLIDVAWHPVLSGKYDTKTQIDAESAGRLEVAFAADGNLDFQEMVDIHVRSYACGHMTLDRAIGSPAIYDRAREYLGKSAPKRLPSYEYDIPLWDFKLPKNSDVLNGTTDVCFRIWQTDGVNGYASNEVRIPHEVLLQALQQQPSTATSGAR